MTVAMVLIFATCVACGVGLTFHSGLTMRAEERFFGGWVIGIIAFTITGIFTTRLFTMSGWAVAISCCVALAASLPGWRRGIDQWFAELVDLKDRSKQPIFSGDNPWLLAALSLPLWFIIGRMFAVAYQTGDGGEILVGHLASFSDWQAHLTYTASFAYAENTALNLPLSTGDNIGYHAGINYFAALLVPAGATLPGALQVSGAFTLFAFPGIMYSVGMRVFKQQAVAILGTLLFLFLGGWGFVEFFKDVRDSGIDVLGSLPRTYTRLPELIPAAESTWWNSNPIVLENPIVGHFFPQRPTMIGFPVVLLVLSWLYTAWTQTIDEGRNATRTMLFCGVLVGVTPFFNLFAFGTPLAFVGLWWIMTKFHRDWLYFLVPAVVLALPVVIFLQPPSSSLEYPYNWVQQIRNPTGELPGHGLTPIGDWLVFWFRNLGFFLPLLAVALAVRDILPKRVALGLMPIWLFFVVPNAIKPHPWNGNNTHYFIFVMLLGALPVAALIVEAVKRTPVALIAAAPLVLSMTLSGAIDIFATNDASTDIWPVTAMDSAGIAVGEWARTTDPDAVFVIELGWADGNASPHQHPVPALSGRDVVIGNDGWVFDLGIEDWFIRKEHSQRILEGGAGYEQLLATYDVDYLVIGPDSRTPNWNPNIPLWEEQADVVYRHGGWTVYKV